MRCSSLSKRGNKFSALRQKSRTNRPVCGVHFRTGCRSGTGRRNTRVLAGARHTDSVALSKKQEKAWAEIKQLAGRIAAADLILISSPMWNYGIPYKLKHLIDVVSQKDVLFTFDDRGQLGMLKGKKAVAMCARGVQIGEHLPKDKFDFQTTYLTMWFNMVGVTDISILEVERGLFGPEIDAASRAEAVKAAKALAARI